MKAFGEFVLLLFLIVVACDTVGTTTTQTTPEVTSATCELPCDNCTTAGQCLQRCPDGYYYDDVKTTTMMSQTTTTRTTTTATTKATTAVSPGTSPMVRSGDQKPVATETNDTAAHPSCRKCTEAISNCMLCFQNQSTVYCSSCYNEFHLSSDSKQCQKPGDDDLEDWEIALIVVGSVLALVLAGVAIFFVVRWQRGGDHHSHRSRTPPPLPPPGTL